jgi:SpoVK/Ycf46/Vps4 family AAA+-type ATPase
MSHDKDFIHYVRAGYPLIVVRSSEKYRVIEKYARELDETPIKDQAGKVIGKYGSVAWDYVDGCRLLQIGEDSEGHKVLQVGDAPLTVPAVGPDGATVEVSSAANELAPLSYINQVAKNGTVIFLKDYHDFLKPEAENVITIKAMLQKLANEFRSKRKCIVLLSPSLKVPMELEKDVAIIDFALPDRDTLKIVLEMVAPPAKMPKGADLESVLDAAAGMTAIEAENAFSVSLTIARKIDAEIVRREKAQVVKKEGLLEIIEAPETMDDIGGNEILKEWITTRSECFSKGARDFGVKPPKGILLIGIPGCGKSLTAKASASGLKRPLARLDMGKIFGSYVGESEENMTKCITVLESIAPCVLWIDEIEKGLSGNKAGSEGHETTRRVFQLLLTWLSEKKKDVLLFATANSVESLPPELMRAGRIDATFYVDLPERAQREEILRIHLKKVNRDPKIMDAHMDALMTLCDNFTGAEIECWVNETLTHAYARDKGRSEITVADFAAARKEVTPIYQSQSKSILDSRNAAIRNGTKWASKTTRTQTVATAQSAATRVIDMGDAPAVAG